MISRKVRKEKRKHTFIPLSKPKSLVLYIKSIMNFIRCNIYKFIIDFWLDPKVTKGQDLKFFLYFSHPRPVLTGPRNPSPGMSTGLLSFEQEQTT
jgi:hypothetical protein